MKTKHLSLLLILSLLLNAYAILKIGGLNRDIMQQSNQLQSQLQGMDSQINGISSTIEQKLNEQASLLSSHKLDFGDMNPETFKVPVQVTVMPKRLEQGTLARLIINGQEAQMTIEPDYSLRGTLDVSIFEELHTSIIFENETSREVETLMVYSPLRYDYLPNFNATFNGQIQNPPNTDKWRILGEVYIALEPNEYKAEVKSVKLLELLDGVTVKTHEPELRYDMTVSMNQEVQLKENQTYELMAVMEDRNGLTYNYLVDGFYLDSSGNFNGDYNLYDRITIVDSEGKEVFSSEK